MIALALVLGLGIAPTVAQADTQDDAASDTVVDGSSFNSYLDYLKDEQGNYSTVNVGRIWTDKSVFNQGFSFTLGDLTDQKVEKGNSDFLVALSALSSASTPSMTYTQPLDIVLVLDVSGSMNDPISYTKTYNVPNYNDGSTYFWVQDDIMSRLYWRDDRSGWCYYDYDGIKNYVRVQPKTSESDNNSTHHQFYVGDSASGSKMDALKSAVNSFIGSVAEQNESILNADQRHEISIVKFASNSYVDSGMDSVGNEKDGSTNYSQIVSDMTDNVEFLEESVGQLTAGGYTAADYGLTLANRVLGTDEKSGADHGARADAQKIVVFFTDGEPNHVSGFDSDVATTAIEQAGSLKDAGALVYSIAVVGSADPSAEISSATERNINAYLHGISSNYPKAEGWSNSAWNLGERVEDSNYYEAATNADELKGIFDEISREVTAATRIPTLTEEGNYNHSGYITITDLLGDYMQVDGFKEIIYGDERYAFKDYGSVATKDGTTVDTYTFEKKVTGNTGGSANLHNILITVTRSDDLATGDVVEVKIPASLIPLRHFYVHIDGDTNAATMTVDENYPIRLFYGVSVKDGVFTDAVDENGAVTQTALIKQPDVKFKEYAAQHQTEDGSGVLFYSNAWEADSDGNPTENGCTTSVFEPAATNGFYYIGTDKPVYKDEGCTIQATKADVENAQSGTMFYYQRPYYVTTALEPSDGVLPAKQDTEIVGFPASNFEVGGGEDKSWKVVDNKVFILSTAHRLSSINDLHATKDNANATGTAENIINPTWSEDSDNANNVVVYLGNNGRLQAELTGSLAISKSVNAAEGFTVPEDGDFTFTVALKDASDNALSGSYNYAVVDKNGNQITNGRGEGIAGAIENGTGSITLKADQTILIYGLPNGAKYTVTEAKANGFTASATVNGVAAEVTKDANDNASVSGSIEAGVDSTLATGAKITTVAFTNTYKPDEVVLGSGTGTALAGQKTLAGRAWKDGETFSFTLEPKEETKAQGGYSFGTDGDGSARASLAATATKPESGATAQFAFGDVAFSKPGDYTFTIKENVPEETNKAGGMTYDGHTCTVTVKVKDDDSGKLVLDGGVTYSNTDARTDADLNATDKAAFTNTYNATVSESETAKTNATFYKKLSGRNWLDSDEFSFTLEPATEGAPMPTGAVDGKVTATVKGSEVRNDDGAIPFSFGEIRFTRENLKNADDSYGTSRTFEYHVTENDTSIPGVYKDGHTATLKITLTDNGNGTLSVATTVVDGTFTNTYSSSTTYNANGVGGLNLTKTLNGRDMKSGQFEFTVTAKDEASAAKAGFDASSKTKVVAVPSDAPDGQTVTMHPFSGMIFNQDDNGKTYEYTIAESKGGDTSAGYTNDTAVHTVKISVADDGRGAISVTTTVDGGTPVVSTKANPQVATVSFTNNYAATGSLDGNAAVKIEATKTLAGRAMTAGEFSFKVVDKNNTVVATGSNAAADAGVPGVVTFGAINYSTESLKQAVASGAATKAQSGAYVFKYQVYEVSDADTLPAGVTHKEGRFSITVTVTDNGDGTLTPSIAYPDGMTSLSFENTYDAESVQVGLRGAKVLSLGDTSLSTTIADVANKFTFTLEGVDGAPTPEPSKVSNDAAGNVDFGNVTFTKTMLENASEKTFTYKVSESGSADGVQNDTEIKTFTVTVKDNGQGKLVATTSPASGALFTFDNTYSVESTSSSLTDSIKVTKTLSGRTLHKDDFTFQLIEGTGADAKVVATGTNDAVGMVSMGAVTFDKPGVRQFTLVEKSATGDGVTYDSVVYDVFATVTDSHDGTLSVAWSLSKDSQDSGQTGLTFANTYDADPTSVMLGAAKTLAGKDGSALELEDGQFSFELRDAGGKVVGTATNDADGQITFPALTFDKVGTYTYEMSEVAGNVKGMTYDGTVFKAIVTVTDDGKGHLSASVAYDGDATPVFANVYSADGNGGGDPDDGDDNDGDGGGDSGDDGDDDGYNDNDNDGDDDGGDGDDDGNDGASGNSDSDNDGSGGADDGDRGVGESGKAASPQTGDAMTGVLAGACVLVVAAVAVCLGAARRMRRQ